MVVASCRIVVLMYILRYRFYIALDADDVNHHQERHA